ncbi:hypothetical protein HDU98_010585 [Podochytrium sp. JEL0797]|nr:hypothetical protein HDU98_010585 [Podochytrium sp. JEL0797]
MPTIVNESNKSSVYLEVDLYFADIERSDILQSEDDLKFKQSRRFKLESIFDKDHYLSLPVINSHSMVQFDETAEASATPTLLKTLLLSCLHGLRELQEAIEAATKFSTNSITPESLQSPTTARDSVQTMLYSSLSKYRIMSDAKIVGLVANCLMSATKEVHKSLDDGDLLDVMFECGTLIDEFIEASRGEEVVAGLIRVVELVSSKIQCYLMSDVNEEDTMNDIEVLADRLVSEIVAFIREQRIQVDRISFVCHSLGGLIARCAIQNAAMDPFRSKFDTFISLSSPHLSLYFHGNTLVGSALRLFKFVGKSQCIDQMNLRDKSNPRSCLVYKLAVGEDNGLFKFRKVKFFGAPQDGYVPITSSLVNMPDLMAKKEAAGGQGTDYATMLDAFIEMSDKMNSIPNLEKYSVWFGSAMSTSVSGAIDDVIGRKAHIAMLTDLALMQILILLNCVHI